MKISSNFNLEEFLVSQTAARHGIDMTPTPEVESNIRRLVFQILQPLRDDVGPLWINSGYRPPDLNSLIGGSRTSAHRFGCAADIRTFALSPLDLAKRVVELDLPFDQVIHEFGSWVHVGIRWDENPPRKQQLTAYNKGGTKYVEGLLPMDQLT